MSDGNISNQRASEGIREPHGVSRSLQGFQGAFKGFGEPLRVSRCLRRPKKGYKGDELGRASEGKTDKWAEGRHALRYKFLLTGICLD